MNQRLLPSLLRLVAIVLIVAGLGYFFINLGSADGGIAGWSKLILPALLAIGLSLLLLAAAQIVAGLGDSSDQLQQPLGRVQFQIAEVQHKIDNTSILVERLFRNRTPVAPPAPQSVMAHLPPQALQPIMDMLHEVRDLALLTDQERHDRLTQMEHERKLVLVREALDHIENQKWTEGEFVLATLEREHPTDLDVRRTRQQFDDARRNAELDTVSRVKEQIENLMAISSWDLAQQNAARLVSDFPGNVDGKSLLAKVSRERDNYRETSVSRMIEEIRHDTDRRLWRRALMHSQRLIEKFPDHPKVQRMREQLATLQENAEIEERQELEVRIQEHVRSRDFNAAIQLSEELLHRFPHSPQAEAIETLLPRIRDLAKEEESTPAA